MTKDRVLFHLRRRLRELESIAIRTHDGLSTSGFTPEQRRIVVEQSEKQADEARDEAEAIREAILCVGYFAERGGP